MTDITQFKEAVEAALDGCQFEEVRVSYPDGSSYITTTADIALAAIQTATAELLEGLKEQVAIDVRMAWSDEDGAHMETKVFETNFAAGIDPIIVELRQKAKEMKDAI